MSSTLAPPPLPQCWAGLASRRRPPRAASRSRFAAPSQPRAFPVSSSAAPSAARSATAHPHGSRRSALRPAPASTAHLSARRALTTPAVLDVPSQRASPAACRDAAASAADGADVAGRLSAEEREAVGSADVAIITNGPGEVAAWVAPVVASLARLFGPDPRHLRISVRPSSPLPRAMRLPCTNPRLPPPPSPQVLLAPCPHASGNELAVLRAMPHVHRCTVRAQGGRGGCGWKGRAGVAVGAERRAGVQGAVGLGAGNLQERMEGRTCDDHVQRGPQDFLHMLLFTRPAAAAGGQHTGGGRGEGEASGGRADDQQRHQAEGEREGQGERKGEWGWRRRGVVVFLGGEQANAVLLARRLGYRCLVYAEDAARWPWWVAGLGGRGRGWGVGAGVCKGGVDARKPRLVDMSALRSPVLLPAIPPALLAARRARVVGDLFLSAVAQAQGTRGAQEGRREEGEVVVGLLPGSKDVKLMVGVPFFLSVAHALNKTCSHG
ncbi:unnamed protein product [Closterium sp. NIES-53]